MKNATRIFFDDIDNDTFHNQEVKVIVDCLENTSGVSMIQIVVVYFYNQNY